MNYLLDKKNKRNKFLKIAAFVLFFVILFYFKTSIFSGLSYVGQGIFRPVLVSGNGISQRFKNFTSYFLFKNSLYKENLDLKAQIEKDIADRANYYSVLQENTDLKETLGRKKEGSKMVLGAILTKPNQNPYDTVVLDIGSNLGLKEGDKVFAFGDIPVGRIVEVYPNSSRVTLFSTSGEKTQVVFSNSNTFFEIIGRGGGNFEMIIPRDFKLLKYDQVVLPGITPYIVASVETVISDPRDSFQKALLVAPVNIQNLKFLEVEI